MSNATSTGLALFIIRLTVFLLMIMWAVLKIMAPESYAGGGDNPGILQKFYGVEAGVSIVYAMGAAQILFLFAYLLGLFKFWTTGGVMLMNLASMVVSMPLILDPTGGEANILFLTAVPVFGASLAHFLMRRQDTFLSLGR